jgi:hypothetical protein
MLPPIVTACDSFVLVHNEKSGVATFVDEVHVMSGEAAVQPEAL